MSRKEFPPCAKGNREGGKNSYKSCYIYKTKCFANFVHRHDSSVNRATVLKREFSFESDDCRFEFTKGLKHFSKNFLAFLAYLIRISPQMMPEYYSYNLRFRLIEKFDMEKFFGYERPGFIP